MLEDSYSLGLVTRLSREISFVAAASISVSLTACVSRSKNPAPILKKNSEGACFRTPGRSKYNPLAIKITRMLTHR